MTREAESTHHRYDAAVVGAGLAGMMAALRLAQRGRSVLVLDRRAQAGGRCGTFELDGHRFTIGCNDFGARIARDLSEVGVHVEFTRSTSVIDFGDFTLRLPPGPSTALRLLWHAPSILRLVRRVRGGGTSAIGGLYAEEERIGFGFRLLSLLAYALGTTPQSLRTDALRAEFSGELEYGHDRPLVPIGGPQAITDAMVARLDVLGAVLSLGVEVGSIRRVEGAFELETSRGRRMARTVLTTLPVRSSRSRPGLKAAQLLFVLPRSFAFAGARTVIISPERADRWIDQLDQGHWPERWGFHVFQDQHLGDVRTVTGYLLAPRGNDRFDAPTRARVLEEVERGLSRHMPGFSNALLYRRLLDPHEYEQVHGLSAALSHEVPTTETDPLPIEGDHPGLFRIGNAVAPPGDHANAAMLSGLWAADRAAHALDSESHARG